MPSIKRAFSVYVAGSSAELDRVGRRMAQLRDAGITVEHDWVAEVMAVGSANPAGASDADRAHWAWTDLVGVKNADLVWVLQPVTESAGAWVELGYALALNKRVLVSGGDARKSVFTALVDQCFDSDAGALDEIVESSGWWAHG